MLTRLRRTVSAGVSESTLDRLVRARHGETAPQLALRRLASRAGSVGAAEQAPGHVPVVGYGRRIRARVVDTVDAHAVRRENLAAVSRCLELAGVEHALVPAELDGSRVVAVSSSRRADALHALASGLTGGEWAVTAQTALEPVGRAAPVTRLGRGRFEKPARLRLFQVLATAAGAAVVGAELGATVEFWREIRSPRVPRADGGSFLPGTLVAPLPNSSIVAYLSPTAWAAATAAPGHWHLTHPALFDVREPVDIVYTWVDGSDPAWLARKAACGATVDADALNDSATHDSRFTSRDELRYSLRSVAMYASWARRIFIVTDQQVPAWLDVSHPKIEVVDHRQIFRDPGALPVFNSHAIESQLHHIEGLAEHYLYLNDDFFFGRLVEPELFFHGNGIAKFFLSPARLDIDPPSSADLPVMSAAKRNRELIEARFGASVIQKFKHTPGPQLRSVLEQLEREYPEVFEQVSHSRFRHPEDLSITSALHHLYAFGLGRAVPGRISYVYQDIAAPETVRRLNNLLRTQHADVFCLNDHVSDPAQFAEQSRILEAFLSRMYPLPSPYER